MKEYQSLSRTRWDCKYPVVFIPKRRKKKLFGTFIRAQEQEDERYDQMKLGR